MSNKTLFKNQAAGNIWPLLCSLLTPVSKSSLEACFCLARPFRGFYLFVSLFLFGFKALSEGGEWKEVGGEERAAEEGMKKGTGLMWSTRPEICVSNILE